MEEIWGWLTIALSIFLPFYLLTGPRNLEKEEIKEDERALHRLNKKKSARS